MTSAASLRAKEQKAFFQDVRCTAEGAAARSWWMFGCDKKITLQCMMYVFLNFCKPLLHSLSDSLNPSHILPIQTWLLPFVRRLYLHPFFASLGLILVLLTFLWYGEEKHPPIHSCCLVKQELQHASLSQHKLTLWPLVYRTSRGEMVHKTYSPINSCPFPSLFLYVTIHLKVKKGL